MVSLYSMLRALHKQADLLPARTEEVVVVLPLEGGVVYLGEVVGGPSIGQ